MTEGPSNKKDGPSFMLRSPGGLHLGGNGSCEFQLKLKGLRMRRSLRHCKDSERLWRFDRWLQLRNTETFNTDLPHCILPSHRLSKSSDGLELFLSMNASPNFSPNILLKCILQYGENKNPRSQRCKEMFTDLSVWRYRSFSNKTWLL